MRHNLIIIGSGPAGLTAAIYAARAALEPILITGNLIGGLLTTTTLVENYPGFSEGINGPELMQNMLKQSERFGTTIIEDVIISVNFENKLEKILYSQKGIEYKAKSVIIASGSASRSLNVPGEKELTGRGVSTCATCDGAFFRNKVVAVVGGGDSAMEEALFLTKFASRVYIIHRRDQFKASKIMQERVFKNEKIEIIWNNLVKEIKGIDKVNSVVLENTNTQDITELKLDGVFIAIGHVPNTQFLQGQIELDEHGYIKTFDVNQTHTSVEGVFVAGDVFDHRYKQAITAAGSGCKAALEAEKYLENII